MLSYRKTGAVVYQLHDSNPIDKRIKSFFSGEKDRIIKWKFDTAKDFYEIFAPESVYNKVKGWMKLPVEDFWKVQGKFWKAVKINSAIYNTITKKLDLWLDGSKVKEDDMESSQILKDVIEGKE